MLLYMLQKILRSIYVRTRHMKMIRIIPTAFLFSAVAVCQSLPDSEPPYTAMGVKVGEVTPHSALLHVRLTARPHRNDVGMDFPTPNHNIPLGRLKANRVDRPVAELEGDCPGKAGFVRIIHATNPRFVPSVKTRWIRVRPESDFACTFPLNRLQPENVYLYQVETALDTIHPVRRVSGSFRTAPEPNTWRAVSFTVITGQHYMCRDTAGGYKTYAAMKAFNPDFLVSTGDNVYYDNEPPLACGVELARYHWHRMYSQPLLADFFRTIPGYWEKDDHDILFDDCYPALKAEAMLPLTFEDGQRIFREAVPVPDVPYRRLRWGRGLEIWLTEGRDFRSPNPAPDGPEKTIWGKEQKAWLKRTLLESDARFRVLVSPTPLVGPDRSSKGDNHSNAAFAAEGKEFRNWVHTHKLVNFFVACGDRHWQYHSVDPETGLQEFSCGPVSNRHAGGSPGEDPKFHRFHRVGGGFLSISLRSSAGQPELQFRFHDVNGNVLYEYIARR